MFRTRMIQPVMIQKGEICDLLLRRVSSLKYKLSSVRILLVIFWKWNLNISVTLNDVNNINEY